jgi:cell division protein ZapA (FtsZ GTPase activity inhibitor)
MATLNAKIWGENFTFSSDEDDIFMQRVANYLNDKMEEVAGSDKSLITTKTAALRTSCVIAGEYLRLLREVSKLELTVDEIEKQLKICE